MLANIKIVLLCRKNVYVMIKGEPVNGKSDPVKLSTGYSKVKINKFHLEDSLPHTLTHRVLTVAVTSPFFSYSWTKGKISFSSRKTKFRHPTFFCSASTEHLLLF